MPYPYLLARLTGSDLIDESGRATGPVIAQVLSRHRTLSDAYAAQRKASGYATCPAILTGGGKQLSEEDRAQLDALQAGCKPYWA